MFGFDHFEQNFDQDQQQYRPVEGNFGHEALAGIASFGAMKIWEDHQRRDGKPVSHSFAKEALAGLAGAEVDKHAEEYNIRREDADVARRQAQEQVQNAYDNHYGGQDQYDPNYGPPQDYQNFNDRGYNQDFSQNNQYYQDNNGRW